MTLSASSRAVASHAFHTGAAARPDGSLNRVVVRPFPSQTVATDARERTRRVLNVAVALIALPLCVPLMLVIAIAIKLNSPGPVLYTQPRVGRDRRTAPDPTGNARRILDRGGRLFRIYKFRTMFASAAEAEQQIWARPDDPRVTAVGRVLRKYRLDELPQLWNVLKGDMNIVGPRPEQPVLFAGFREQIEGYGERQRVLPGITGLAQVRQHYDRCIDDVHRKLLLDLEYLRRRSVAEDLRIMALTIPVVLFQRGAW